MRFNTRLSIVAIVAMLFMVSTVSAGIMSFLGMKKKGPERRYYGQLLDVRGAFGIKDLKITKMPEKLGYVDYLEGKLGNSDVTLTCMEPNTLDEIKIRRVYQQVAESDRISKRDSKSSFYFASTEFEVKAFRKQCIVSRGVCRWYLSSKKLPQLSNTYIWKYFLWRISGTIGSIERASREIWRIGNSYNFKLDNICYDSHNRMLLNRYDTVIPLAEHTEDSLEIYDNNLNQIYIAICTTLARMKGIRRDCSNDARDWTDSHSNSLAYRRGGYVAPPLPLYEPPLPPYEHPPPYVRRPNPSSN
ncbi:hypothetical protein BDF22DRAFT_677201 [Syncephalis plumigaleata]|nr:hypothetical protein BDF22DRAFT_677201 [Syncephalis plumigaleata]